MPVEIKDYEKDDPEHPGVLLHRWMRENKVCISYFAKHIKYSRTHLHKVLRGQCAMTRRLANALNQTPILTPNTNWWLDKQRDWDNYLWEKKIGEMRNE